MEVPVKRPTNKESDEDLLKEQELFLKQKFQPSVHIEKLEIKREPPEIEMIDNSEKTFEIQLNNSSGGCVQLDIQERVQDFSRVFKFEETISAPNFDSEIESSYSSKPRTKSIFAQKLLGKGKQNIQSAKLNVKDNSKGCSKSLITEESEMTALKGDTERQNIHEENLAKISQMSKEAILEYQEQLKKHLSPEMIIFLKNRKKAVSEKSKDTQSTYISKQKKGYKYAIASFKDECDSDESIEILPINWFISDTLIYLPNTKSPAKLYLLIKECSCVEPDWIKCNILKIYSYSRTYKSAESKLKVAIDTSNMESDLSSASPKKSKKKRRRPLHFNHNDSSPEENCIEKTAASKVLRAKKLKVLPVPHTTGTLDFNLPSTSGSSPSSCSSTPVCNVPVISADVSSTNLNESRILKLLEEIKSEMKEMRKDIQEIKSQFLLMDRGSIDGPSPLVLEAIPSSVKLPIDSEEDLIDLNAKLKDDIILQKKLARYLHSVGSGKNESSFLTSITRKLLTRELAIQYSRCGRKKKKSFSELVEMFNVILAAAALKFSTKDRQELQEKFGRVLATAGDWDGHRYSL